MLTSIPMKVTVSIGHAYPSVIDLLSLQADTVIPLDRRIDDPVDLYVDGYLIARGELEELKNEGAGQLAVRLVQVLHTQGRQV